MAELATVSLDLIDANPFRLTAQYPFIDSTLATLQRSYADVGMWEGVIGRRAGNRVQCAFGHHRVEAARRAAMPSIPVIIRDLTDEQMLQFMGRENMEDFGTDFLRMLETWEAAEKFLSALRGQTPEAIDIAQLLGWTDQHQHQQKQKDQLNRTARACYAAHALIEGNHLNRSDLRDISVHSACDIVERAQSRIETIERTGSKTRRPREEIDRAKSHVGTAAKETARQAREGSIAQNKLRSQVDVHAFREARNDARQSPLFEVFGKALADSIARMLKSDSASERLEEVRKAIGMVTLDDDVRMVKRLDFELSELGERTAIWRKRITPTDKKVRHLQIREDKP